MNTLNPFFLPIVLTLSSLRYAAGSIKIINDSVQSNLPSDRLGHGTFTGNTEIELAFVAASYSASTSDYYEQISQELLGGIEDLIDAIIHREERGRVSFVDGERPHVFDISDTVCSESLNYAEAGTECVHFFVSVPLTIHNGPEEYIARDIMKSKFLKAINLEGTLYDAIKGRNDETSFIGIGKPGAPLLWS